MTTETFAKMHFMGEGGDIVLPLNPSDFPITRPTENIVHHTFGAGYVSIGNDPKLREFTIESQFWSAKLPEGGLQAVNAYKEFFEKWQDSRKYKRLVVEHIDINILVLCNGFDIEYRAKAEDDIYYTLNLIEHPPFGKRSPAEGDTQSPSPYDNTNPPPRPPENKPPTTQTYTIVPGDNLWAIARKHGQDGTAWRELYNYNRDMLHQNVENRPSWNAGDLIFPGQMLQIPTDWGS
ncbi:MAG: LysM peptidoglycan-binding domain-containing protein [Defluviitaleaceae bacterium]|nr:LysM peptidoglycan-binding domain-containing protein [Defluviitaleaceae bacterium]